MDLSSSEGAAQLWAWVIKVLVMHLHPELGGKMGSVQVLFCLWWCLIWEKKEQS